MMTDDMLKGVQQHNLNTIIAIGHSMGGIASLIAAVREPGRFKALVLLDPMVFQAQWMDTMAQMQRDRSIREFPLAVQALRRRRTFESAEAAFQNWRDKPLFRNWPDETLRLYAHFGTRPSTDGQGVELVWSPEWEAYYFCTAYTRTWEVVPQLSRDIPLLVIRGEASEAFTTETAALLRDQLPHMTYAEVPGHGHLFPLSAPEITGKLMMDWLKKLT
jgi:pimeloyl-ACP methyl ester carboxylesterase